MSKAEMKELETSDDDYVDPSIEKYFKKKEGKKAKNDKKPFEEESESDYEVEDDEDEPEDDSDDENEQPEAEQEDEEAENETENGKEPAEDGRKKLTMKMIEKWAEKLGVSSLISY